MGVTLRKLGADHPCLVQWGARWSWSGRGRGVQMRWIVGTSGVIVDSRIGEDVPGACKTLMGRTWTEPEQKQWDRIGIGMRGHHVIGSLVRIS